MVTTETDLNKPVIIKLVEIYHWFKFHYQIPNCSKQGLVYSWVFNNVKISGEVNDVNHNGKVRFGLLLWVSPNKGGDDLDYMIEFIKHMWGTYTDIDVEKTDKGHVFYW